MAERDIIRIDESRCDGCGDCVPVCAEGAIQIVDGTARLINDTFCDGLGACLGHCPQGAITVERRDAADFDEAAVERHLAATEETRTRPPVTGGLPVAGPTLPACPGSRGQTWQAPARTPSNTAPDDLCSRLQQWPIQLHLLSPSAPQLAGADVLLAADCVAFAVGDFHRRYLDGRSLAIACPKLDTHQEVYIDKLATMIDHAEIRRLEIAVMEVPCCAGLVRLVQQAMGRCRRSPDVEVAVIGIRGDELTRRPLPPVVEVQSAEPGRRASASSLE